MRRELEEARHAMRAAIEARKKPDIVHIFVQVRNIHAEAAGSETYFAEANNTEARRSGREVRLGAEGVMGGWLADLETAQLRYMGRPGKGTKIGTPPDPGLITLDDLGIDRHESQRWQAVAKLSPEEFAALVADDAATSALLRQLPESRPSQGPKVLNIALSSISISSRLRSLRQEKVDALAGSMLDQGLLSPIIVRPEGDGYELVVGHHRYAAAQKLGWEKIDCIVRKGLDAVQAELCEIDENLIRADLTPAEQAAHHARRKELYEQKYGKAKAKGAHKANRRMGRRHDATDNLSDAYTTDAAKKTGKNPRSVRRDVARGKNIPNVAELAGTSLDQGTELDALVKLKEADPDRQAELIEKAKSGEKVSAKAEVKKARPEKQEAELDNAQPAQKTGAFWTSFHGLANIQDVDFGSVAAAMRIDELLEERDKCEKAAFTLGKWRDALNKAIETVGEEEPAACAPLSGERTKCVPTTSS
jgi:ParB/RepB/Spo0J family partition protein